jgi:hypothetical protein
MSAPRAGRASSPLSRTHVSASVSPTSYLSALDRSFQEACERAGAHEIHGRLAGWDLNLRFAGAAIRDAIAPAFSHLEADGAAAAQRLTVCIWDGRSTGAALAVPPWRPEDVRELGQVLGFNDARFSTTQDATYGGVTLVDRDAGVAYVQAPDTDAVPWYERAAPLRAALRALTSSRGSGLVHAGAVGTGGDGVIVAGRSGSGKSTLVAAAAAEGLVLVGDDYVLLTLDPEPGAHCVHSSIKLSDETLELLPELAAGVRIPAESVWAKNVVDLEKVYPGQLVKSLRIRGIVLPTRSDGAPRLAATSAAAGVIALAPSTTFQLPPLDGDALAGLARLAREVPTYTLHTGDDPREAARLVRGLVVDGG